MGVVRKCVGREREKRDWWGVRGMAAPGSNAFSEGTDRASLSSHCSVLAKPLRGLVAAAAATSVATTWGAGAIAVAGFVAAASTKGQVAWVGAKTAGVARQVAKPHGPRVSLPASEVHTEAASFCGSSLPGRATAAVTCGLVALLAAPARRRRRKEPPAPRRELKDELADEIQSEVSKSGTMASRRRRAAKASIDGKGMDDDDLASNVASAFAVTDEDRRRRKMKKLIAKSAKPEELADYALDEIMANYEDPEFFNFPFIWVQLGHVILLLTALIAAVASDTDSNLTEFALFDLQGPLLDVARNGIGVAFLMNICLGALMYYEENELGEGRGFSAIGWMLKGFVLGGVAYWQREYKVQLAQEKLERDAQKLAINDAR